MAVLMRVVLEFVSVVVGYACLIDVSVEGLCARARDERCRLDNNMHNSNRQVGGGGGRELRSSDRPTILQECAVYDARDILNIE